MKQALRRFLPLLFAILAVCVCLSSCNMKSGSEGMDNIEKQPSGPAVEAEKGNLGLDIGDMVTPTVNPRKIVKVYHVNAETKEYTKTAESLRTLISSCGGYIESSVENNRSLNNAASYYSRNASYKIRIPAERSDEFMTSVGGMLNVTSATSEVEDISDAYYSAEAMLTELKAERNSLLDILDASETKSDYNLWLTVNQRLSEVRQQIAVLEKRLENYDDKVAYSTVNLTVTEVIDYTFADRSFGSRVSEAFRDGWVGFVTGMQDFTVWLVGALPVLLLLAVIVTVILLILFAASKKRKK